MRSIWKGAISFGLVSVPVKVYSATENHDIPLHQVAGLFPTGFLARRGITLATDEHNRDRIRNVEGKVIGRNAIDLVMQATGMPFDQSVTWLKDRLGPEMATQAAVARAITQVKSRLKPVDHGVADSACGQGRIPVRRADPGRSPQDLCFV